MMFFISKMYCDKGDGLLSALGIQSTMSGAEGPAHCLTVRQCFHSDSRSGSGVQVTVGVLSVVTGVNQLLHHVVLGDHVGNQQEGGAVVTVGGVVGLSVVGALKLPAGVGDQVGIDSGTAQDGLAQIQGNHGLVGHGLVHGHGLQAVHQVLQVGLVAVLTGDDGLVGAGVVSTFALTPL